MSASVWPESLRNFWKSASFGKACFFCLSKEAWTSLSETLMFICLASPSIHLKEISSWRTWSRSELYSDLHCALSWESVTLGWPLAGLGVVLRFCAMHSVNFGGFGGAAVAWPPDLEATVSQWATDDFSSELPSTVATASPGTPPQPATSAAGTKKAPSARVQS